MNNIKNNVVTVGLRDSGKTMYLVGMYNMFSRILGEFDISSKIDRDEVFLTKSNYADKILSDLNNLFL